MLLLCVAKRRESSIHGKLTTQLGLRGFTMKEKELIAMWDSKRNQIIMTQLAPSIVLATAFVLASLGAFMNASHQAKYFAIGVVAVTGILAAITNLGIIRESEAIIMDLKSEKDLSALGKKISESRELVMLNLALNFIMSAGVFALAVFAILK